MYIDTSMVLIIWVQAHQQAKEPEGQHFAEWGFHLVHQPTRIEGRIEQFDIEDAEGATMPTDHLGVPVFPMEEKEIIYKLYWVCWSCSRVSPGAIVGVSSVL